MCFQTGRGKLRSWPLLLISSSGPLELGDTVGYPKVVDGVTTGIKLAELIS